MENREKTEGRTKRKIRPSRLFCGVFVTLVIGGLLLVRVVSGGFQTRDTRRLKEPDYTVLDQEEVPEELWSQIELRRSRPFHLTWQDGEELYLVEGYGTKETGGYSIRVRDCYLSSDTLYIDTELVGPMKGETVREAESFPVIVVKTRARQQDVVFR